MSARLKKIQARLNDLEGELTESSTDSKNLAELTSIVRLMLDEFEHLEHEKNKQ